MSNVPEYHAPPDGHAESADPHFKSKVRPCGFCGETFETSAAFRYFCPNCRCRAHRYRTQHKVCPPIHRRAYGLE